MEENFQKYEANVTHVRNLFSPEDISIRREADLTRVPRGHRVAHDESIGSANVSICLTDVQPAISPRHLFFSLFFIPNPKAIFPSENIEIFLRDCLSDWETMKSNNFWFFWKFERTG